MSRKYTLKLKNESNQLIQTFFVLIQFLYPPLQKKLFNHAMVIYFKCQLKPLKLYVYIFFTKVMLFAALQVNLTPAD